MSSSSVFRLAAPYQPAGDQPHAIDALVEGLVRGDRVQTLLGATGTGKTFTMANVIQRVQRPTLVIAHNKTLAAQLCNEFRQFFPENAVEYFVSYYDYYQPEAYLPSSDTYIEKEAMINEEIDRLRHSATQALLTRRDVIIVSSVSCIYGLGAPEAYRQTMLHIEEGEPLDRDAALTRLVDMQFTRMPNSLLTRGSFFTRGDLLEVMPAHEEMIYRIETSRGKVVRVAQIDPVTREVRREQRDVWIFPAKHFVTLGPERERAIVRIREELRERVAWFESQGKILEADRLERRTKYDLELLETVGYCNGVENYSQPLSGREPGLPPDTLFSYFPKDFVLMIDESHVTIPQLGAMSEGDRVRKQTLIDHGFRLPSAADNRPMRFAELEAQMQAVICVSATPSAYEAKHSAQIVEQIIRPTGLVDPQVHVVPITPGKGETGYPGQVRDLLQRVKPVIAREERVLVTTLTKKMAQDLTDFLQGEGLKVQYLHSGVETVERLEILTDFRRGKYDILVGVNLLREGLDMPEVSLVAILDADKEGFLRSETSLIQTIGRAARNVLGEVILYADTITRSMQRAIAETERRRTKQIAYNEEHGITPQTIRKQVEDLREVLGLEGSQKTQRVKDILALEQAPDSHSLTTIIKYKRKEMKDAAKDLQFELAAILRDEITILEKEEKRRAQVIETPEGAPKPTRRKPLRHGRTK